MMVTTIRNASCVSMETDSLAFKSMGFTSHSFHDLYWPQAEWRTGLIKQVFVKMISVV